ncbi:MAG TPA: hypothetical protein VGD66_12390 [Allosphingosinicella sp.]|jgi:hypothetical protein
MKILAAAALIAGQILAAAPASAADLLDTPCAAGATRVGAFAGARLRVPLGGGRETPVRLGLALAPVQRTGGQDGATKLRFGEGLEFGLAGRTRPALSVAGYRVGGEANGADGRRLGVSTIGAAGIAGAVIVAGFLVLALAARSDGSN